MKLELVSQEEPMKRKHWEDALPPDDYHPEPEPPADAYPSVDEMLVEFEIESEDDQDCPAGP